MLMMFRMMMMREAGGESEKFSSCVEDGLVVSQVGKFIRIIMTFLMILFVSSFKCLSGCLRHMFVVLFVFTYNEQCFPRVSTTTWLFHRWEIL